MKIEIKGWIHASPIDHSENGAYTKITAYDFYAWEKSYTNSSVAVCEHTLVAEVPEVEPISLEVDLLRNKRAEIAAEAGAKMKAIDEHLEKLLALTNEATS